MKVSDMQSFQNAATRLPTTTLQYPMITIQGTVQNQGETPSCVLHNNIINTNHAYSKNSFYIIIVSNA